MDINSTAILALRHRFGTIEEAFDTMKSFSEKNNSSDGLTIDELKKGLEDIGLEEHTNKIWNETSDGHNTITKQRLLQLEEVVNKKGRKTTSLTKTNYFKNKESMWAKVRTLQFMLHTQHNERNIHVMELSLSLVEISNELEKKQNEITTLCEEVDSLMSDMKFLQWNKSKYDEWNIVKVCECELSKTLVDGDIKGITPYIEMSKGKDTDTTDLHYYGTTLSQIRCEIERLQRKVEFPETLFVLPSACSIVDKVNSFDPTDVSSSTLEGLITLDNNIDTPVCYSADVFPSITTLSVHTDDRWSWPHRNFLKKAINEMQTTEDSNSIELKLIDKCDTRQLIVKANVKRLADLGSKAIEMNKLQEDTTNQMQDTESFLDKTICYREYINRKSQSDINRIDTQRSNHERCYLRRTAREVKESEKNMILLFNNTIEVREACSKVVQLLRDRYVIVSNRFKDSHAAAKRDGEYTQFKIYSERHKSILRDLHERSDKHLALYRKQKEALEIVKKTFIRSQKLQQASHLSETISAHKSHLIALKNLKESMTLTLKAKKVRVQNAGILTRGMLREKSFCQTTNDIRLVDVDNDINYLSNVRSNSVKLVSKMALRLEDVNKQAQWSINMLDSLGGDFPNEIASDFFDDTSDTLND